jgi:hypothetical protein
MHRGQPAQSAPVSVVVKAAGLSGDPSFFYPVYQLTYFTGIILYPICITYFEVSFLCQIAPQQKHRIGTSSVNTSA